jgi:hypothetical protein
LGDVGDDADAAVGGDRFKPFVEVGRRHDPLRSGTGLPGPRPCGAADGVDDEGPVRHVVPVEFTEVGKAGAGGADGDPGLVEQVNDTEGPRVGDGSADECDVDLGFVDRGERIVAADEGDRASGRGFEEADGVLCPGVGQQPAEPEADAGVLADRADAKLEVVEDPGGVGEELVPGWRQ